MAKQTDACHKVTAATVGGAWNRTSAEILEVVDLDSRIIAGLVEAFGGVWILGVAAVKAENAFVVVKVYAMRGHGMWAMQEESLDVSQSQQNTCKKRVSTWIA